MASDFPECKYRVGDKIMFILDDEPCCGEVYIVDRYGTFEQNEEPSYDVFATFQDRYTLVKHIRQSRIDKLYERRNACRYCKYFKDEENCNTGRIIFHNWCKHWQAVIGGTDGFCYKFEDKEEV